MAERERIEVKASLDIDYGTLDALVKGCGGFIRGGGQDGEFVEVWHDDKTYVFSGEGLIKFLYALRDQTNDNVYAALDLCDYIAGAVNAPPSVFMRDAIVARAAHLQARIKGESK